MGGRIDSKCISEQYDLAQPSIQAVAVLLADSLLWGQNHLSHRTWRHLKWYLPRSLYSQLSRKSSQQPAPDTPEGCSSSRASCGPTKSCWTWTPDPAVRIPASVSLAQGLIKLKEHLNRFHVQKPSQAHSPKQSSGLLQQCERMFYKYKCIISILFFDRVSP